MSERNQQKPRKCNHPGCDWRKICKAHELKEHARTHPPAKKESK